MDDVPVDSYYNYRDKMRENCRQGDKECIRFRNLLTSWPKDKPKAAIYIVVGGRQQRNSELPDILTTLDKYFNNKFRYPVILFSESFTKEQEVFLRMNSSSDIYLQELDFKMPEFLHISVAELLKKTTCKGFGVGYRHMCRFQSKLVYEEPILKGEK